MVCEFFSPKLCGLYANFGSEHNIRLPMYRPRIPRSRVNSFVAAVKIVLHIVFIRSTGKFEWNNYSVLKQPVVLYKCINKNNLTTKVHQRNNNVGTAIIQCSVLEWSQRSRFIAICVLFKFPRRSQSVF